VTDAIAGVAEESTSEKLQHIKAKGITLSSASDVI
jgi:hypothetical protein